MKNTSLFDIISPVMTGPSSSHTAGAVRLGLIASEIYDGVPEKITFNLYNSYAETGEGHGTDKGLLAGVLGMSVDDENIRNIFDIVKNKNIEYKFTRQEDFNRHPNAVDIIFEGKRNLFVSGMSVGAGNILINKINGFSVELDGRYNCLVMVYADIPGMIYEVTGIIKDEGINIASLICDRSGKDETASMCVCLDGFLSDEALTKIKKLKSTDFVKQVRKIR